MIKTISSSMLIMTEYNRFKSTKQKIQCMFNTTTTTSAQTNSKLTEKLKLSFLHMGRLDPSRYLLND